MDKHQIKQIFDDIEVPKKALKKSSTSSCCSC